MWKICIQHKLSITYQVQLAYCITDELYPSTSCISALNWLNCCQRSLFQLQADMFSCSTALTLLVLPFGLPLKTTTPGMRSVWVLSDLFHQTCRRCGSWHLEITVKLLLLLSTHLISLHSCHHNEWKSAWRVPLNLTTAGSMFVVLHALCLDIYSLYWDNVVLWSYW